MCGCNATWDDDFLNCLPKSFSYVKFLKLTFKLASIINGLKLFGTSTPIAMIRQTWRDAFAKFNRSRQNLHVVVQILSTITFRAFNEIFRFGVWLRIQFSDTKDWNKANSSFSRVIKN